MSSHLAQRFCLLSLSCCVYYKVFRCQVFSHGTQIQQLFKHPVTRKAIGGHRKKAWILVWMWNWFVRQESFKVALRARSKPILSSVRTNPLSLGGLICIIPLLCSPRSFSASSFTSNKEEKKRRRPNRVNPLLLVALETGGKARRSTVRQEWENWQKTEEKRLSGAKVQYEEGVRMEIWWAGSKEWEDEWTDDRGKKEARLIERREETTVQWMEYRAIFCCLKSHLSMSTVY